MDGGTYSWLVYSTSSNPARGAISSVTRTTVNSPLLHSAGDEIGDVDLKHDRPVSSGRSCIVDPVIQN